MLEQFKIHKPQIAWNGGRNGWASFILGFGWMPNKRLRSWGMHIYLGLWVVTIRSKNDW